MTREEIIRFLRQLQQILIDSNSWKSVKQVIKESFSMAIEALEAQKWIPVKERLPEEAGWYLCTYKDGRVNTKYWSKGKGWVDNIRLHMFELYDIRSRLTKKEVKLAEESIYWNDWVVAWSRLPEPYKEDKDRAKMEREQKHLGNKSDLVILDEVKYE